MTIHIHLNNANTENMILDNETLFSAIKNKQEEIQTVQLSAVNFEARQEYNYIFYYNGEKISISKDEMNETAFYNCLQRVEECCMKAKYYNSNISKDVFQIVKDCKEYWNELVDDVNEENEKLANMTSVTEYIKFRVNDCIHDRLFMFLIIMIILSLVFCIPECSVAEMIYCIIGFVGIIALGEHASWKQNKPYFRKNHEEIS